MNDADKEILKRAQELVAGGLDKRKAIIKTLLGESGARRTYLWNLLERKLRKDSTQKNPKGQAPLFQ